MKNLKLKGGKTAGVLYYKGEDVGYYKENTCRQVLAKYIVRVTYNRRQYITATDSLEELKNNKELNQWLIQEEQLWQI